MDKEYKVKEKTTIVLEKEDCALVLRGDGSLEFTIPDMDPEATPSNTVIAVTLLAVMFKKNDKDLDKFLMSKYNELMLKQVREK
jgi:hypothetical protein